MTKITKLCKKCIKNFWDEADKKAEHNHKIKEGQTIHLHGVSYTSEDRAKASQEIANAIEMSKEGWIDDGRIQQRKELFNYIKDLEKKGCEPKNILDMLKRKMRYEK